MAPDNPASDGDAGTVTTSTAPASSTLAAAGPPPPAPSPSPATAAEPHTSAPQASRPPPTSSGLEPAVSASSTSTDAALPAPTAVIATNTPTATAAAITSPTAIPDTPALTAEATPPSHLNGTGAAHTSSASADTDMSNHLTLLGRQAAVPAASHPSPSSRPSGYPADSQPQLPPAPSTAAAAPPPSANPTTQFASYSTIATSQTPDVQRPVHSNGPNAVTLPSMRTIDALTQQQPQSASHPHAIGGPLQPASPSGQSYYAQATVGATPGYGLHSELSRYPLPHDPRLPGTRGSKKCDEAHPTCNNCKKSKRDCLGYDPIFRQQPAAQPGSIQPAPSPTASLPSSNSPGSAAGNGRPLNSYASQPSILPTSYASSTSPAATASPTPNTVYQSTPVTTTHPATSAAADSRYDYPSGANPTSRPYQPASAFDPARHVDHTANSRPDHRLPEPGEHNRSSLVVTSTEYQKLTPVSASKMRIHQIIDSLGPTPTPPQVPASEETFSEITKVYHEMYATALAAFFETTWYYFAENGIMSFPKHPPLLEQMASFLKVLEAVKANDHTQMAYSGILETRIVWELACTAFQTPERGNASIRVNLPPEGDSAEARSRLLVVDTLLCGEYLPNNPLSPPVADSDVQRTRQFDFWYNLADFIRHRDNPESPQAQQAREEVLGRMRRLLDARENRDVLYSIAVVRHLSPNFGPNYGTSVPQHLDETDPKNRLAVASKFIMDEAQVTGGTTNVVRRISDIACRAFVNPGVNIARRS
ncbi:C6 finger domain-containing protein [Cordyceps javanica]|uniref:C6 finger domain-containing protein n=1 Tax=Cordyceps javanica TaxID=43265 RepID=A0A545VDE8_9HYPO|nr:C6 finger domain-containing protein [Cordyceps javanica]